MPPLLVPLAGKALGLLALLVAFFGLLWWAHRRGLAKGRLEAKAEDARLRAEATKASLEGYVAEKTRLEDVDPVSGRPLPPDRL